MYAPGAVVISHSDETGLRLSSIADRERAMSSKIVFGVALALASLLLANIGSAEDAPPLHKGPWPIRGKLLTTPLLLCRNRSLQLF